MAGLDPLQDPYLAGKDPSFTFGRATGVEVWNAAERYSRGFYTTTFSSHGEVDLGGGRELMGQVARHGRLFAGSDDPGVYGVGRSRWASSPHIERYDATVRLNARGYADHAVAGRIIGATGTVERNLGLYSHVKVTVGRDAQGQRLGIVSSANISAEAYGRGNREGMKPQLNFFLASSDARFVNQVDAIGQYIRGRGPRPDAASLPNFVMAGPAAGDYAVTRVRSIIRHSDGDVWASSAAMDGTLADSLLAAARAGHQVNLVVNDSDPTGKADPKSLAMAMGLARRSGNVHVYQPVDDDGRPVYMHGNMLVAGTTTVAGSMRFNQQAMSGRTTDVLAVLPHDAAVAGRARSWLQHHARELATPARVLPTIANTYTGTLERMMPLRGSATQVQYAVDPAALVGARNFALAQGRGLAGMEAAPGLGSALYGMLNRANGDGVLPLGAAPAAVLDYDRAAATRTLGQSGWFPGMWGIGPAWAQGPQLGNRGPLDSLLIRLARSLDATISRGNAVGGQLDYAQEHPIETTVAGAYDLVANSITNMASYYFLTLPFMRIQRDASRGVHALAEHFGKQQGIVGRFSETASNWLTRTDRSLSRVVGTFIEEIFDPLYADMSAELRTLVRRSADLFFDRGRGAGTITETTFAGKRYKMHHLVDEYLQRSILRPFSSAGVGRVFEYFGPEFLADNLGYGLRLAGDALRDLRDGNVVEAHRTALDALTDNRARAAYVRAHGLEHLLSGQEAHALAHVRARLGMNVPTAADLTIQDNILASVATRRATRAGAAAGAWGAYVATTWREALGLNTHDQVLVRRAEGMVRNLLVMGGVAGVVANQWAGDVMAAQRSTVFQQRRLVETINGINRGDRVPLQMQYTPGMPTWDRDWAQLLGGVAGGVGRAVGGFAGLVAGAGYYTLQKFAIAPFYNARSRLAEQHLRTQIMGKGAYAQALAYARAGELDRLDRLAAANPLRQRQRLEQMAASLSAGRYDTLVNELLVQAQSVGLNQRSSDWMDGTSASVQITPDAKWGTLTLAANNLNNLTTFSLTMQAPVWLTMGLTLTMPFARRTVTNPDRTQTTSWEYSPNSSLENLSYLGVYAGAGVGAYRTLGLIPGLAETTAYKGLGAAGRLAGWLPGKATTALFAPLGWLHRLGTDALARRGLMAAGVTEEGDLARILGLHFGSERVAALSALKPGVTADWRVGLQPIAYQPFKHINNRAYWSTGGRGGLGGAAHTAASSHWMFRAARAGRLAAIAGASAMVGTDLALSFYGGTYRQEADAANMVHDLASRLMQVPGVGMWAANYFNVAYKTHPVLNSLEATLGPRFGQIRGNFNDHPADLYGFMHRAWDRIWRGIHSVQYGGTPSGFVGTGLAGMVTDRPDKDVTAYMKAYVQPSWGPFQFSLAVGAIGAHRRGNVDDYLDALNAQMATFQPGQPFMSYRMSEKAAVVGRLFHEQSGVFALGASARLQMQNRMATTTWLLHSNVTRDTLSYFFLNRRRQGSILNGDALPPMRALGVIGQWTRMGDAFRTSEQSYSLFRSVRDDAVRNGTLGELDFEGPDALARTDDMWNAPKGKNAFTQFQEMFETGPMLAVGIGLNAAVLALGVGATALLARLRGVGMGPALLGQLRGALGDGAPHTYMTSWGVDATKDETMLIRTGAAHRGGIHQAPGHRYWLHSIGEGFYTYGDVGAHGHNPLAPASGWGGNVKFRHHQRLFRTLTELGYVKELSHYNRTVRHQVVMERYGVALRHAQTLEATVDTLIRDNERASAVVKGELAGLTSPAERAYHELLDATHQKAHLGLSKLRGEVYGLTADTQDFKQALQHLERELTRIQAAHKATGAAGSAYVRAVETEFNAVLDDRAGIINGRSLREALEDGVQKLQQLGGLATKQRIGELGFEGARIGHLVQMGGGPLVFGNSLLRTAWRAIGAGLLPGTAGFMHFDTYKRAEAVRFNNRYLATTAGAAPTASYRDMEDAFYDLFDNYVRTGKAAKGSELSDWARGLEGGLFTDDERRLLLRIARETRQGLGHEVAGNAGLAVRYTGAMPWQTTKLAGRVVAQPLLMASDAMYLGSHYAGTLYGLGMAADTRISTNDRLGAAKAGLQDVGGVVRGDVGLLMARGLSVSWTLGRHLGPGFFKAAGTEFGKLATRRALGTTVGALLAGGAGAGLLGGDALAMGLAAATGGALAVGGGTFLAGAFAAAGGLLVTEALFNFTPLGQLVDNAVERTLSGSAQAVLDRLDANPVGRGVLFHTARVIGGVQSALDMTFDEWVRKGQDRKATTSDRMLGWAGGVFGNFYRLLSPGQASFRYYEVDNGPGTSTSLNDGLWALPENAGAGAGLNRMTPLFYGTMRDATTQAMAGQDKLIKGAPSVLAYSLFHQTSFGQGNASPDSVMTGAPGLGLEIYGNFGQLSNFGQATQQILSTRAEATQPLLYALQNRVDVWGVPKKQSLERSSGYLPGLGDVASWAGVKQVAVGHMAYIWESIQRAGGAVTASLRAPGFAPAAAPPGTRAILGIQPIEAPDANAPASARAGYAVARQASTLVQQGYRYTPTSSGAGRVRNEVGVCADFVMDAFKRAGLDLEGEMAKQGYNPRWAPDQHKFVTNSKLMRFMPPTARAQVGDIIFFDWKPGDQTAWHVGLVTGVDKQGHVTTSVESFSHGKPAAFRDDRTGLGAGQILGFGRVDEKLAEKLFPNRQKPALKPPAKPVQAAALPPALGSVGTGLAGVVRSTLNGLDEADAVKGYLNYLALDRGPLTERQLSARAVREVRTAVVNGQERIQRAYQEFYHPNAAMQKYYRRFPDSRPTKFEVPSIGIDYGDYYSENPQNSFLGIRNLLGTVAAGNVRSVTIQGKPYWQVLDKYDFNQSTGAYANKLKVTLANRGRGWAWDATMDALALAGAKTQWSFETNLLIPKKPGQDADPAAVEAFRRTHRLGTPDNRPFTGVGTWVNENVLTMTPFGGAAEGQPSQDAATKRSASARQVPLEQSLLGGMIDRALAHNLASNDSAVQRAVRATGIEANALRAILSQESHGGENGLISSAGAVGPMQVMPGHYDARMWAPGADNVGWARSHRGTWGDANANILKGAGIFRGALKAAGGDLALAASAYNGGEGGAFSTFKAKGMRTAYWAGLLTKYHGDVVAAGREAASFAGLGRPGENTLYVLKVVKYYQTLVANQASSGVPDAIKTLARLTTQGTAGPVVRDANGKWTVYDASRTVVVDREADAPPQDDHAIRSRGAVGVEALVGADGAKVLLSATYPNGEPWKSLWDDHYTPVEFAGLDDYRNAS